MATVLSFQRDYPRTPGYIGEWLGGGYALKLTADLSQFVLQTHNRPGEATTLNSRVYGINVLSYRLLGIQTVALRTILGGFQPTVREDVDDFKVTFKEVVAPTPRDGICAAYRRVDLMLEPQGLVRRVVVVAGPSRSGKSTLINALGGVALESYVDEFGRSKYRVQEPENSLASIGEKASTTIHCNLVPIDAGRERSFIVDTGGISDTRGENDPYPSVAEITGMASLHALLTHRNVQSAVLVFCVELQRIQNPAVFWGEYWQPFVKGIFPDLNKFMRKTSLVVTHSEGQSLPSVRGMLSNLKTWRIENSREGMDQAEQDFFDDFASRVVLARYSGEEIEGFKRRINRSIQDTGNVFLNNGEIRPSPTALAVSRGASVRLKEALRVWSEQLSQSIERWNAKKTLLLNYFPEEWHNRFDMDQLVGGSDHQRTVFSHFIEVINRPKELETRQALTESIELIGQIVVRDREMNLEEINRQLTTLQRERDENQARMGRVTDALRAARQRQEALLNQMNNPINPPAMEKITVHRFAEPFRVKKPVSRLLQLIWSSPYIDPKTPVEFTVTVPRRKLDLEGMEFVVGADRQTDVMTPTAVTHSRNQNIYNTVITYLFPLENRGEDPTGSKNIEIEVKVPDTNNVDRQDAVTQLRENLEQSIARTQAWETELEDVRTSAARIDNEIDEKHSEKQRLIARETEMVYRNSLVHLREFLEIGLDLIKPDGEAMILYKLLTTCPQSDWGEGSPMLIFSDKVREFRRDAHARQGLIVEEAGQNV